MNRKIVSFALVSFVLAVVSSCGLSSGSAVPFQVKPGSIRPIASLHNVPITIGSKDFTEQILLAYIAEYALSAAGMEVLDLSNISGSNSGRQALTTGQTDLMWDYTGTAWISYMGNTKPIPDSQKMFDAVKKADASNGIDWIVMAPLNNTYTVGSSQEVYEKYRVSNLSELAELSRKNPAAASFCLETEFGSRNDGFPGMAKFYRMNIPPSSVSKVDFGVIYQAVADHRSCNFGEITETDARQLSLNLKVIADDQRFFPAYNAAVTIRHEMYQRYPQIRQVLAPIAAKLTSKEMLNLSAEVDVRGKDWAEVAKDWMIRKGFVRED